MILIPVHHVSTEGAPDRGTFLPDDPHQDGVCWPNGLGELTDRGRAKMLNFGRFLRQRYAGFLTDHIGEVNLATSPKKRCQETGRLVVSGAYGIDELSSIPIQIDEVTSLNTEL